MSGAAGILKYLGLSIYYLGCLNSSICLDPIAPAAGDPVMTVGSSISVCDWKFDNISFLNNQEPTASKPLNKNKTVIVVKPHRPERRHGDPAVLLASSLLLTKSEPSRRTKTMYNVARLSHIVLGRFLGKESEVVSSLGPIRRHDGFPP